MTALHDLDVHEAIRRNERAGWLAIATVGGVVGVLAVLVTLFGLWLVGLGVVVAGGVGLAYAWFRADRWVLAEVDACPIGEDEAPRLHNVVEALCVANGMPTPALFVVDDGALNCFAVGRDPEHASIAVTQGLLESCTPVELEGVLAHEFVRIHQRDTLAGTVAAWCPPAPSWGNQRRMFEIDRCAVTVTRYPPGLTDALVRMADRGVGVTRSGRLTSDLWFQPRDVLPPDEQSGGIVALEDRIAALREL